MRHITLLTLALSFSLITGLSYAQQKPKTNTGTSTKKPASTTTTTTSKSNTATPSRDIAKEKIEAYKAQAEQQLALMEVMFNILGDPESTTKDKEVVINQTYAKVFASSKVQIEDDLEERREVVTNKDVQAYLKDIDFFFREVQFSFDVQKIDYFVTPENKKVFKLSLNRQLEGINLDGKKVSNARARFVEMNLDEEKDELRIASVYTSKLDVVQELRNWWTTLPSEWKEVFSAYVAVNDTEITDAQVKALLALESVDLSNNARISDLNPISELENLRSLNISGTLVMNLLPLRNLSRLEELQLSSTTVSSLEPVKYLINLKSLVANDTRIEDISPLSNLIHLERLHLAGNAISDIGVLHNLAQLNDLKLSGTRIASLQAISGLKQLEVLDISETSIAQLNDLSQLSNLERLSIDKTKVKQLSPLKSLKKLRLLFCNHTPVSTLSELGRLPALEKIYCDQSGISRAEANQYMASNPGTLVVMNSEILQKWWETMPRNWQTIFSTHMKLAGKSPSREQLSEMANITELNIEGKADVRDLDPLSLLINLKKLNANFTGISSLGAIRDLRELEILELQGTKIESTDELANLVNLSRLNLNGTGISSLNSLHGLNSLRLLLCDNTQISREEASSIMDKNPNLLVVFMSATLQNWWTGIPAEWKKVFNQYVKTDNKPTPEQLHQIAWMESLEVPYGTPISTLSPVTQLLRLKSIHFSGTNVSTLEPLANIQTLREVHLPRNPVADLQPLANIRQLLVINAEGTAVSALQSIAQLTNLKELSVSGTKIKNLKGAEGLTSLEKIELFNTQVSSLKPLESLTKLKSVKCYNTRISKRNIDKFKELKRKCEVVYY